MSTVTARPAPTAFAVWLRAELDGRGWGVRTLARHMNPENPEAARRKLNHYLAGTRPGPKSRASIADALGVPKEDVPSDDAEPG